MHKKIQFSDDVKHHNFKIFNSSLFRALGVEEWSQTYVYNLFLEFFFTFENKNLSF